MPNLESILSILKRAVKAEDVAIQYKIEKSSISTSLSIIKEGADYLIYNESKNELLTNQTEIKFPDNKLLKKGKLIFTFKEKTILNDCQNDVINASIIELIHIETNRIKNEQIRIHPLYKEIIVENLISNMTEGVMIFDTTHKVIHFNATAKKLFGLNQDPLIYKVKPNYSMLQEGGLTLIRKEELPSRIALNGKKIESTSYFIKKKVESKGIFVKVNATPIRNDDGVIIAAVVTLNDISESIQQESEIKQQSDLLQQASMLAEVGYWELNLELGTVYWSDITRKIHETEDSFEPTLAGGINFYDDESKPIITETVNKSIESGKGWDVQLKIITAKGNKKWVRSIAKCYQELGNTVKIAGVFQDITKEKEQEEILIESRDEAVSINEQLSEKIEIKDEELNFTKERYSILYDDAPDLMASVDIKGRSIIDCNEQTAKTLGYSKNELIGKPLFSVYHPSSHNEAKKAFDQFLENGVVKDVRLVLKKKDGSLLNVMLNASAIRNEKGEIIQTNSVWRDITELVIAEEKLQQLNAKLEQKVKDRTKALEIANEEIEDFTYMATHDLKAPIANIKGHLGIVKLELGKIENHIVNDCFMWMDNSIDIAESKIRSIVKVAQLQFQDDDASTLLDAEEELNDILTDMSRLILENKANIVLDVKKNFQTHFIKDNFRSIFTNLIHNAIKYKQLNSSPDIVITLDHHKNQHFISVADKGLGFDEEVQKDAIFGMFKRIHDHVEGDGMGLHLVKKIIDKSGGKITVNSKINEGSTFTVYFKKLKN